MVPVRQVRSGDDPYEYDTHRLGTARDYNVIVGDDISDSITANWISVSNCVVSAVVINPTKEIDGITYSNVVTARINVTAGPKAESRLEVTGVTSSELQIYLIDIPVAS